MAIIITFIIAIFLFFIECFALWNIEYSIGNFTFQMFLIFFHISILLIIYKLFCDSYGEKKRYFVYVIFALIAIFSIEAIKQLRFNKQTPSLYEDRKGDVKLYYGGKNLITFNDKNNSIATLYKKDNTMVFYLMNGKKIYCEKFNCIEDKK